MAIDGSTPLTPFEDLLNAVIAAAAARLQKGSATATFSSSTSASTPVTFTTPFDTPPEVMITPKYSPMVPVLGWAATAVTVNGFTLIAYRTDGGAAVSTTRLFGWVAVGA